MSNIYNAKSGYRSKPLKGGSQNVGVFDNIIIGSINNIKFENIITEGLIQDVTITNSLIDNTIIGSNIPNIAFFTELTTTDDVTLTGDQGNVEWNSSTSVLQITNTNNNPNYTSFIVDKCSQLGNIKICDNTISAVNANGDIIFKPNGTGKVVIPYDVSIKFGTTGNISTITGKSDGSLIVSSETVEFGSSLVTGNSFDIQGGNINNTAIGATTPSVGTFTDLKNTTNATLNNVQMGSTLMYSYEKYTMGVLFTEVSPSVSVITSMFSVSDPDLNTSGTMPSTSILDGTFKILVCSSMAQGSTYTVHFDTLIAPNPLNELSQPTKIAFKRQSQSAQLIYDTDAGGWILLSSGGYVS